MTDEETRLLTVTFGEGWSERAEMGLSLIDIPALQMPRGEVVHAIFVRGPMNGYPSRLVMDRAIQPSISAGMHTHPFLGQVMYAHSISDIPAALAPHEAILAHVRMYK